MAGSTGWTRRRWQKTMLAAGAVGAAGLAGGAWWVQTRSQQVREDREQAGANEDLSHLVIYGGPATPSVPLVRLAQSDALAALTQSVRYQMFRGHDELLAGLVGNGWPVSMVPTHLAANLYNKGMPVRYMAVLTWGLVYLVSREPDVASLQQLQKSRLVLFGKNDLYDHLLRDMLKRSGLRPDQDVTIMYTGSPVEAVQWIKAGNADHVLLAEPQCTAALEHAVQQSGPLLYRGLSLGDMRKEVYGDDRIPLAGVMLHERVLDSRPELAKAIATALPQAVAWTLENPQAAAQAAGIYFSMPAQMIAAAIPHSRLTAQRAADCRETLMDYLEMIGRSDAALIGGKVPDGGFFI